MEKDDWLWPLRGGTRKERLLALAGPSGTAAPGRGFLLLRLGPGPPFLKHLYKEEFSWL
jgi:hypothetical protein